MKYFFEAEAGRCQVMLHVWGRLHGGRDFAMCCIIAIFGVQ